ncbi:MAG: phosphoenolpyruvate carboxykinase (ATP) [Anaerolineales bacterium]
MTEYGPFRSEYGLENHGIANPGNVYWNLTSPMLYEEALRRYEGVMAHLGPMVVRTGDHTGRSPKDKFIARTPEMEDEIWWGPNNMPISPQQFDVMRSKMLAYIQNTDLFVFDGYVGADPAYQMPIRVITQYAWHSLFARNMFIREFEPQKLRHHQPEFTVIDMPRFKAHPEEDGVNSSTIILVNFNQHLVLIGGTEYAGEIKKSIFTAMNYYLPRRGVLSMHCSANYGQDRNDVALFFGLSGTGKTTLSNDVERTLIGDDEHGWSDQGVFNLEGGCYAKVIRLDPEGEPQIYEATRRFGTLLENVVYDSGTRRVDRDDDSLTENTRASYPISHIDNASRDGTAGHPRHIIFLTADAFGVLPPISRLSRDQAMYHFLSGYTAKVAGTERGVKEPTPVFSACFGAPFMPLHPVTYADLLGEKIDQQGVQTWLVNTGWTGGSYGEGSRIKLAYTRRMVSAALGGELDRAEFRQDEHFGVQVPTAIEGVPSEVLDPRTTWSDAAAYDEQADKLTGMFVANFRQYHDRVNPAVRAAGP